MNVIKMHQTLLLLIMNSIILKFNSGKALNLISSEQLRNLDKNSFIMTSLNKTRSSMITNSMVIFTYLHRSNTFIKLKRDLASRPN